MPLSWREGPALEERHNDHYDYDDDGDEVNDDDDDYDDDFNDNNDGEFDENFADDAVSVYDAGKGAHLTCWTRHD